MFPLEALNREFYVRDPEIVAKELLGKRLVRKLNEIFLEGIIVETEAYYGLDDPASRAYHGIKNYNKPMWKEPGRTFIYNVRPFSDFYIETIRREYCFSESYSCRIMFFFINRNTIVFTLYHWWYKP